MSSAQLQAFFERIELAGPLGELEQLRRAAWRRIGISLVICAGLGALTVGLLHLLHQKQGWTILAVVVAFVIWAVIAATSQSSFASRYKLTVVPRLLTSIGPDFSYTPEAAIDSDEFDASGLFKSPDRYHGQDYVEGWHGKTALRFSLVHAEEEVQTTTTDSDGHTRTETHYNTIFRGLFFSADFNKHFAGHTRVFAGRAGWFSGLRGDLVKLEDPQFGKLFTVTSNDQIEARYILSPALMERLKQLRAHYGKVQLAFVGSRVLLAIPTSMNMLTPRFFRRCDTPEAVAGYLAFLQNAIGLVDDLNLNLRIWSKS